LETQKAIANFLDCETARIDQLVEKKQRMIELLHDKFRSLVVDAVTRGLDINVETVKTGISHLGVVPIHWEIVGLGKKIVLQRGVDITKDQQDEDGEYPVVSSGGVASYHSRFICKGPGVLVGRKGSAGKLHYEKRNYWPHDTTLYVKHFFKNVPRFVFYKLMSLDLESFDRSSANPTINRNVLHPVKVSWPPLDEQRQIAQFLDSNNEKHSGLVAVISKSIDRLREFRCALVTAAVTGQIDVAGWATRGGGEQQLAEIEGESAPAALRERNKVPA
jgi:type I restriction enzyme S subunit